MKTAMQQLIDALEHKRDAWKADGNISERRIRGSYVDAIITAKELLELEKQQITKSYAFTVQLPFTIVHIKAFI